MNWLLAIAINNVHNIREGKLLRRKIVLINLDKKSMNLILSDINLNTCQQENNNLKLSNFWNDMFNNENAAIWFIIV